MDSNHLKKENTWSTVNWLWISGGLGIFYWFVESLRDVLVFHKGDFFERVFLPDPVSFWLRILVVCIFILFGVYAQNKREKIEGEKKAHSRASCSSDSIIKAGLGFGVLYWILDSVRDVFLSDGGSVIERILNPDPMEFWMRMLAVFILFLFSIYAQSLINQRKRAEDRLREGEERVQQIIQQMPYPINVCAPDGTAAMVNKAFLDIIGEISSDLIVGRYNVFKDPLIKKMDILSKIKKAFEGETIFIPEVVMPAEALKGKIKNNVNGNRIQEITLFPVLIDDNQIWRVVMIWKDITEQKRSEEEKVSIQAQLLQVQKMQAVGILAGGIAHDFNNLLTAIQGSADLAMMDLKEDEPPYADLKEIRSAAMSAADLTRQLLLFSRKHPMGFAPLDINESIKNLHKMIKRLIGEDVAVHIQLKPDLGTVLADRNTMEQVVMNLVVNARDAMPHGGDLTIMTENIVLDETACRSISGAQPGKFICIAVADTGLGMDKDTVQHIFEPFFTTKEPGSGTGLGLSVVYGIIERHGGWIRVFSEPDRGSVFKIYLPVISETPQEKKAGQEISYEPLRGKGERLLVVEDDENVLKFAVGALNKNGYNVFSAMTAEKALEVFEMENRRFDLILSDVILPDKNAVELIDELSHRNPNMGILLGSGYVDKKSIWNIIEERGYRFIQKPYTLAGLLQAVKETIAANVAVCDG
ncbi:MAG: ATP-binding protein [bacterium]